MGPGIRRAGRALGDRQLRPATRSGTPTGPGPHGAAILGLPMWVCPLAFSPESTGPRRCTGGRSRVQAMVGAERSNARPPEPYSGAGHAPEPDSCVQGVCGVQSVPQRARNGPRTPGARLILRCQWHGPRSVNGRPSLPRGDRGTDVGGGHAAARLPRARELSLRFVTTADESRTPGVPPILRAERTARCGAGVTGRRAPPTQCQRPKPWRVSGDPSDAQACRAGDARGPVPWVLARDRNPRARVRPRSRRRAFASARGSVHPHRDPVRGTPRRSVRRDASTRPPSARSATMGPWSSGVESRRASSPRSLGAPPILRGERSARCGAGGPWPAGHPTPRAGADRHQLWFDSAMGGTTWCGELRGVGGRLTATRDDQGDGMPVTPGRYG